MKGMFRGGRRTPTFDTKVVFTKNDSGPSANLAGYRKNASAPVGAPSELYADMKDTAGAERLIGDVEVATTTKSLVFAAQALKGLMKANPGLDLAKDFDVTVAGKPVDVIKILDDWVPNTYARMIVEFRT